MKIYDLRTQKGNEEYYHGQPSTDPEKLVISKDGTKEYFLNWKHHRKDGPAIEYSDGTHLYLFYGIFHREDGPAEKLPDGKEIFWFEGRSYPSIKNTNQWKKFLKMKNFR